MPQETNMDISETAYSLLQWCLALRKRININICRKNKNHIGQENATYFSCYGILIVISLYPQYMKKD